MSKSNQALRTKHTAHWEPTDCLPQDSEESRLPEHSLSLRIRGKPFGLGEDQNEHLLVLAVQSMATAAKAGSEDGHPLLSLAAQASWGCSMGMLGSQTLGLECFP